jgi:RNA polymerase sigma-70 factor (ECF subfamily)
LETLCQTYWRPVYVFIRRRGHDREQAEDLTQEFFTLLLEKNYLIAANRERGRFRSFLLIAVKHFLANQWDREHAAKRGGRHIRISMDSLEVENWYLPAVVDEVTPETLFERRWAESLLEHVMSRLHTEFESAGKADEFEKLSMFLSRDSEDVRYTQLADEMGMSVGALRMAVHRLRRNYRRLLREEIAQTVSDPEQTDEELRHLLEILTA